jgi:hypothetical protein
MMRRIGHVMRVVPGLVVEANGKAFRHDRVRGGQESFYGEKIFGERKIRVSS